MSFFCECVNHCSFWCCSLTESSACAAQGVAKFGLKSMLTLVKASQQQGSSAEAEPGSRCLLVSAWEIAYTRIVDGIDTFGEKQQAIKLSAMQVGFQLLTSCNHRCSYTGIAVIQCDVCSQILLLVST